MAIVTYEDPIHAEATLSQTSIPYIACSFLLLAHL